MATRRARIDRLLVERGLVESRERAARIILGGGVRIGDRVVDKPGALVDPSAEVRVSGADMPYVSRGGLKLEGALRHWDVDAHGRVAIDVGASTGGFTDCLLQHGAACVIALDVGYGQLAWRLRTDPRVVVMERTNIRFVCPEQLPRAPSLAVVDVSFISLRLVLPVVGGLMAPPGEILALVKPQFEVGKGRVGKGGVVRDPASQDAAVAAIAAAAAGLGMRVRGSVESPIRGPKGNREFFLYMQTAG